MASMSQFLEKAVLEHITKRTAYTAPKPWLALCTVVPTSTSTGSTITEANYTGYKRVTIAESTGWNAATSTTPSLIKTKALTSFAPCTAGSSKIVAVVLCDAETLGNMLVWAAVTEFEVSTTATPAEAAAEAIEISLT
jgi:hypothetical protein